MPMTQTDPCEGHFKNSAEYFEGRARRARNEPDYNHHMSAARFYRQLASVTPGFPPGYKTQKHLIRGNRYRNRAEECRAIAEGLTDENCKRQLADLATTYEHLASTSEKLGGDDVAIRLSDAMRQDSALL